MLRLIVIILLLGGLSLLALGQIGMLGGRPPSDLGVNDGRLKPPSATENSVSSQSDLYPNAPNIAYARIEPLPGTGGAPGAISRIRAVVETLEGAKVVEQRPDYLYVQFTTRWLKFVDDAEFWFDPSSRTVQVRSASRLGQKDMGVNRARIEIIRGLLGKP